MDHSTWETTWKTILCCSDQQLSPTFKAIFTDMDATTWDTTWKTVLCCSGIQLKGPGTSSKPSTDQSSRLFSLILKYSGQLPTPDDPELPLTLDNIHRNGVISVARFGDLTDLLVPVRYFAAWSKDDQSLGGIIEIDKNKVEMASATKAFLENVESSKAKIDCYYEGCPKHPGLEFYAQYHPLREAPKPLLSKSVSRQIQASKGGNTQSESTVHEDGPHSHPSIQTQLEATMGDGRDHGVNNLEVHRQTQPRTRTQHPALQSSSAAATSLLDTPQQVDFHHRKTIILKTGYNCQGQPDVETMHQQIHTSSSIPKPTLSQQSTASSGIVPSTDQSYSSQLPMHATSSHNVSQSPEAPPRPLPTLTSPVTVQPSSHARQSSFPPHATKQKRATSGFEMPPAQQRRTSSQSARPYPPSLPREAPVSPPRPNLPPRPPGISILGTSPQPRTSPSFHPLDHITSNHRQGFESTDMSTLPPRSGSLPPRPQVSRPGAAFRTNGKLAVGVRQQARPQSQPAGRQPTGVQDRHPKQGHQMVE